MRVSHAEVLAWAQARPGACSVSRMLTRPWRTHGGSGQNDMQNRIAEGRRQLHFIQSNPVLRDEEVESDLAQELAFLERELASFNQNPN
jgi:hypothetical protein